MSNVRYRLVSWGDIALPIVDSGGGLAWFWGESFPMPKGKSLETLEITDLGLRADPGVTIALGPVEVAVAATRADAWEAATPAGHWPSAEEREAEAAVAAA